LLKNKDYPSKKDLPKKSSCGNSHIDDVPFLNVCKDLIWDLGCTPQSSCTNIGKISVTVQEGEIDHKGLG